MLASTIFFLDPTGGHRRHGGVCQRDAQCVLHKRFLERTAGNPPRFDHRMCVHVVLPGTLVSNVPEATSRSNTGARVGQCEEAHFRAASLDQILPSVKNLPQAGLLPRFHVPATMSRPKACRSIADASYPQGGWAPQVLDLTLPRVIRHAQECGEWKDISCPALIFVMSLGGYLFTGPSVPFAVGIKKTVRSRVERPTGKTHEQKVFTWRCKVDFLGVLELK